MNTLSTVFKTEKGSVQLHTIPNCEDRLLSVSDTTVALWDLRKKCSVGEVCGVSASTFNETLATQIDPFIKLYDARTLELQTLMENIARMDRDKLMLMGSSVCARIDGKVNVYSIKGGAMRFQRLLPTTCKECLPLGPKFLLARPSISSKIIDIESGTETQLGVVFPFSTCGAAVGKNRVVFNSDVIIHTYDAEKKEHASKKLEEPVVALAGRPEGPQLCAGLAHRLYFWPDFADRDDFHSISTLNEACVTSLAFLSRNRVAVGFDDGGISIWDAPLASRSYKQLSRTGSTSAEPSPRDNSENHVVENTVDIADFLQSPKTAVFS